MEQIAFSLSRKKVATKELTEKHIFYKKIISQPKKCLYWFTKNWVEVKQAKIFQAWPKPMLGKMDPGQAQTYVAGFCLVYFCCKFVFYSLFTHIFLFTPCDWQLFALQLQNFYGNKIKNSKDVQARPGFLLGLHFLSPGFFGLQIHVLKLKVRLRLSG